MPHSTPTRESFPLTVQAGRHAAQLWLSATTPPASMATWRDNRFHAHAAGLNFPDYSDRQQAFNDAYAGRIAQAIVGAI